MSLIEQILPYIQITIAVILTVAILLQKSGAELGGALGGGDNFFHSTRRGFEKFLFNLSIVLSVLFLLSALLAIMIKSGI